MPVPGRSKATRPGNEEPGSGSLPWQRTHGNIKNARSKRLSASTSWSSGMQPRNACPDWASHLCPRPEPHGLRRPPTRHSPAKVRTRYQAARSEAPPVGPRGGSPAASGRGQHVQRRGRPALGTGEPEGGSLRWERTHGNDQDVRDPALPPGQSGIARTVCPDVAAAKPRLTRGLGSGQQEESRRQLRLAGLRPVQGRPRRAGRAARRARPTDPHRRPHPRIHRRASSPL